MSEVNSNVPVELSADFLALSAVAQSLLKIDPATGLTTGPKDFGDRITVSEDVTLEMIRKVDAAKSLAVAVAGHAFGEVSTPVLKANPELATTELKVNMTGGDTLAGTLHRDRTGKVNGVPYSKPGALYLSLTTVACTPKSASLAAVAHNLRLQFSSLAS